MKRGVLKAIGHNIADSLASGMGFPIGVYVTDIYGEASASPTGCVTVDFLTGTYEGGPLSESLAKAIKLYAEALDTLCVRHGTSRSEIAVLKARYSSNEAGRPAFSVTVQDPGGRSSVDHYSGWPGKRVASSLPAQP